MPDRVFELNHLKQATFSMELPVFLLWGHDANSANNFTRIS